MTRDREHARHPRGRRRTPLSMLLAFGIAGGCLAVVLLLAIDLALNGSIIDGPRAVTTATGAPTTPPSPGPASRRATPDVPASGTQGSASPSAARDLRAVPTADLLRELARNPLNSLQVQAFDERCSTSPAPVRPSSSHEFADYLAQLRDECLAPAWDAAASHAGASSPGYSIAVIAHRTDPSPPECRDGESASPAWYCQTDGRIYVMADWGPLQRTLLDPAPPLGYAEVLAHEHAHYEQLVVFGMGPVVDELTRRDQAAGTALTSHRLEMQAQCIAQATLTDARGDYRQPLGNAELESDPRTWTSDAEHGTAENQSRWAGRGARSHGDLSVCNTWAAPDSQVE